MWKQSLGAGEYLNTKDKYSYVKVWKTGLSLQEMKRRGYKGTYFMSARIGRNGKETKKNFKTKNEALDYATQYMMRENGKEFNRKSFGKSNWGLD